MTDNTILIDCIETICSDFYTIDSNLKEPERCLLEAIKDRKVVVVVDPPASKIVDGNLDEDDLHKLESNGIDLGALLRCSVMSKMSAIHRLMDDNTTLKDDEMWFLTGRLSAFVDVARLLWPEYREQLDKFLDPNSDGN